VQHRTSIDLKRQRLILSDRNMRVSLLGLWQVAFPFVWSGAISLACSGVFWLLRRAKNLQYGYGTELFSVLLAVDISVMLGTVEVWRLTDEIFPVQIYKLAALILAIIVLLLCWIALTYERSALDAYQAAASQPGGRGQVLVLRRAYLGYQARAYLVRWAATTLHLWWITKTPRWAIFQ
jgi:hypothetical protein